MLTLGTLETEDYLCVNTEKHGKAKFFDTCHSFPVTELVTALVTSTVAEEFVSKGRRYRSNNPNYVPTPKAITSATPQSCPTVPATTKK